MNPFYTPRSTGVQRAGRIISPKIGLGCALITLLAIIMEEGRVMSLTTRITKIAAPLAALAALGACAAPGFRTEVSRFNALPPQGMTAAQGQTFFITTDDPKLSGGIEFGQYADMLTQEMTAEGFVLAANADSADLVVTMGYTVDKGVRKLYRDYDPFYFGLGYGGWGHPYGYYGRRHARMRFMYGWNDPWLFGPMGVESITIYTTELDVRIDRRADGTRVFEGKAMARSNTNAFQKVVPNLVTAMFTDFPGNNGETVKITVMPDRK